VSNELKILQKELVVVMLQL